MEIEDFDDKEVCVMVDIPTNLGQNAASNNLKPMVHCSMLEGKSNANNAPYEHEFNISISSIQEMNCLSSAQVDEEEMMLHPPETPAFSHDTSIIGRQRSHVTAQHQCIPVSLVPAVLV